MSMKRRVAGGIIKVLGRKTAVRFARLLTMEARLDVPNQLGRNGEELVQSVVLKGVAAEGRSAKIFDVGANVGDWTRLLLETAKQQGYPRPSVYCFEPTEETHAALSQRVGAEAGVNLVKKALAEHVGTAEFYVVGLADKGGRNSLQPVQGHTSTRTVELDTVTNFCASNGIEQIDLLKIDAEGHDLSVIKGALELLRARKVGLVQFEYNHCWILSRSFLRDVFELVDNDSYRIGKETHLGVEWYENWDMELESFREGNYLICRTDWVARFPAIEWWGK